MPFNQDVANSRSNGRTTNIFLGATLLAMLCAHLPLVSARSRFNIPWPIEHEDVSVIMDLDFNMTLTVSKQGELLESVQLTDKQIVEPELSLLNITSFKYVYLNYGSSETACQLVYSFDKMFTRSVMMRREFWLRPSHLFKKIQSPLFEIQFNVNNPDKVDIGSSTKSYLCNETETVSFEKTDDREDGYRYTITLETHYFHVQAWNLNNKKEFSPEPPTLCQGDVTPTDSPFSSKLNMAAIIIGVSVAGAIVFFAAIVAVVVVVIRKNNNQF